VKTLEELKQEMDTANTAADVARAAAFDAVRAAYAAFGAARVAYHKKLKELTGENT